MDEWASEEGTSSGRPQTAKASLRPPQPRYFPEVSTEVFAGEYGFELALQELQTDRPNMYMYSQILNRLYCRKGKPCPIPMKVSSSPPPGSIIRAVTTYESRVAAAIKSPLEGRTRVDPPDHPIQVEGNQHVQYFSDKETLRDSVTITYERPEVGSAYTTILYKFIHTRSPVLIVITLQSLK
ncbi:PREDICTED: cellular tumor antigen p53-like [Gekko japonicus]|uniref:Cellular tumor antigen p53-like n=1 Tax=Gekko japonicus TaxID=146911 RepID=A0ABM1KWM8_GEKJA|nr:PREDICTED: cellular tumor antigen p53-like [Gekko japonicus]